MKTFLRPVSDCPAQACPRCPGFPCQVEMVLPLLLLASLQAWDPLLGSLFIGVLCGSTSGRRGRSPVVCKPHRGARTCRSGSHLMFEAGTVHKTLAFWTEATNSSVRQPCKRARGCRPRNCSLGGGDRLPLWEGVRSAEI